MTSIQPPSSSSKKKLHSLKIDMTPMVDLGFLLITFFIFTTTLGEPRTTRLIMPKESKEPSLVRSSQSLTALLDKDKIYVYEGTQEEALKTNTVIPTTYDVYGGLGRLIRQKQNGLAKKGEKDKLIVLLKPLPSGTYQNVINALDEMQINTVQRYAVVDATNEEKNFVAKRQ